ncbi:MAG: hypothetical protein JW932_02300 [Deltaproteobacteria bacterium]|nr:hypothetical protein [Deltaproteobacteria bacterium]
MRSFIIVFMVFFSLMSCGGGSEESRESPAECQKTDQIQIDREDYIPPGADKVTPDKDAAPPVLHLTDEYEDPEPLDGNMNTAGAEDSPFYDMGTDTLYFFFTPDVEVPAEGQVLDPSTGIYRSARNLNTWEAPEKMWLFDVLSLEGCACVQGDFIWYCAAVCGTTGIHHYFSEFINGRWTNGELDETLNDPDYEIGEFHITADCNTIYYHSDRAGGKGGRDLWKVEKTGGVWGQPVNLEELNTSRDEGYPFLTADGQELWFCGDSRIDINPPIGTPDYFGAIFRSKNTGGTWDTPEEVVSQFAGEPTADGDGNVYFVHHFYENNQMIEADIYLIRKK